MLGRVDIDPAIIGPVSEDVKPKAPGMKYRHYAPKAGLTIVIGKQGDVQNKINELSISDMEAGTLAATSASVSTRSLTLAAF